MLIVVQSQVLFYSTVFNFLNGKRKHQATSLGINKSQHRSTVVEQNS